MFSIKFNQKLINIKILKSIYAKLYRGNKYLRCEKEKNKNEDELISDYVKS